MSFNAPQPRAASPAPTSELALAVCGHPAARLYAWFAHDRTLCVCCSECGAVLTGAALVEDKVA